MSAENEKGEGGAVDYTDPPEFSNTTKTYHKDEANEAGSFILAVIRFLKNPSWSSH